MSKKTQQSYFRLFSQLKILKPTLNPASMMSDFELAVLNGFKEVFPGTEQRVCYFHHKQCLMRKLQTLGELNDRFESDELFQLKVKMMPALAFVPVDRVVLYFDILVTSSDYIDVDYDISNYYNDVWVSGRAVTRTVRRDPLYPPKLWNCFEAVKSQLPKTNNDVEGNMNLSSVLSTIELFPLL
jgi:hypothetical protein